MSHITSVEANTGERLHLYDENGKMSGGILVPFVFGTVGYCLPAERQRESDERTWFSQLSRYTSQPFCQLLQPLVDAWYVDAGVGSDREIGWAEAEQLRHSITEVKNALLVAQMPARLWYWPQKTDKELELLLETIDSAMESGITKFAS